MALTNEQGERLRELQNRISGTASLGLEEPKDADKALRHIQNLSSEMKSILSDE